jgi:hypothetical protein
MAAIDIIRPSGFDQVQAALDEVYIRAKGPPGRLMTQPILRMATSMCRMR